MTIPPRRSRRKEYIIKRICSRLGVYDHRDVMKALRSTMLMRPLKGAICAREILTEKELIKILSIARWHRVLDPGSKRKATRYEYVGVRREAPDPEDND